MSENREKRKEKEKSHSGGVMVSKVDLQTYTSEFDSH